MSIRHASPLALLFLCACGATPDAQGAPQPTSTAGASAQPATVALELGPAAIEYVRHDGKLRTSVDASGTIDLGSSGPGGRITPEGEVFSELGALEARLGPNGAVEVVRPSSMPALKSVTLGYDASLTIDDGKRRIVVVVREDGTLDWPGRNPSDHEAYTHVFVGPPKARRALMLLWASATLGTQASSAMLGF